jgi:hypothetical protein
MISMVKQKIVMILMFENIVGLILLEFPVSQIGPAHLAELLQDRGRQMSARRSVAQPLCSSDQNGMWTSSLSVGGLGL